jgi:hypothetical protein
LDEGLDNEVDVDELDWLSTEKQHLTMNTGTNLYSSIL